MLSAASTGSEVVPILPDVAIVFKMADYSRTTLISLYGEQIAWVPLYKNLRMYSTRVEVSPLFVYKVMTKGTTVEGKQVKTSNCICT